MMGKARSYLAIGILLGLIIIMLALIYICSVTCCGDVWDNKQLTAIMATNAAVEAAITNTLTARTSTAISHQQTATAQSIQTTLAAVEQSMGTTSTP